MNKTDQTLALHDGRQVGYAEFGDPLGKPLIYCHGFPASRLEGALFDVAAKQRGIRVIVPDRPGHGLSTFQKGRQLSDWPRDLSQLTDQLQIERFLLIGISGGGPYALAVASQLPERLTALGLVCPLGPVYREDAVRLMQPPARFSFRVGKSPALLRWMYGASVGQAMRATPELALAMLAHAAPPADRDTFRRSDVHRILCASIKAAFRQGVRGALHELVVYANSWGFELGDIKVRATLWHGEFDRTVPAAHSRILAEGLRHAEVRLAAGEGHFSLPINHAAEILGTLCESAGL
jgi:pimeloyl-ACP methyl ester carboxylesterase